MRVGAAKASAEATTPPRRAPSPPPPRSRPAEARSAPPTWAAVDALRREVASARTAAAESDARVAALLRSQTFSREQGKLEKEGLRLLLRARHVKERQVHDVRMELARERREHELLGIVQRREDAWARGAAAAPPRAPLLERLWWWLRRTMILVVYAAFAGACLGFAFGGRSGDRRGGWDEL